MTAMTVMPREPAEWTVDDLDHLPDDGLQYELLDGILLVSPAPVVRHQLVSANLYMLLRLGCPAHLVVLYAPLGLARSQKMPRTSPGLRPLPASRLYAVM